MTTILLSIYAVALFVWLLFGAPAPQFRSLLKRLFTRRQPTPPTEAEVAQTSLDRRIRAQQLQRVQNACTANDLGVSERRKVIALFERLIPERGLLEARQAACDQAAEIRRDLDRAGAGSFRRG